GSYGAGTMAIWDRGGYVAEKWRDDEVIATFDGDRLRGRYALFRTRGDNWMIHRMDPPAAGVEPMPEWIEPMTARLGSLPADDAAHGYEIKWDGVRALALIDRGHLKLIGRNRTDYTARYPELRGLGTALGSTRAIVDGEIVAFDAEGRPSFERLQRRIHVSGRRAIERLARETPAAYVAFDLLWLAGHDTTGLPYRDRRQLLAELELDGPSWQTPAHREGGGAELLAATAERGLEGVVAKRLDSVYEPGRRSSAWIKVKNTLRQEVVIGGHSPGEGARAASLGALVVGVHDGDELRYVGKVGSGFTAATLDLLTRELAGLRRDSSPFTGRQPPRGTVFAEPRLVAEVEFREWTRSGTLRAPVFKGLRDDKHPHEVVRE
ncbi:MAG: DNA ligase, partial [Solirubrobacterales bacterium]|nr:DNA ligase [Solirubrobacterales bacterium]